MKNYRLFFLLTGMLLNAGLFASPVETVTLEDFEGVAPTVADVSGSNSSSSGQGFSNSAVIADSGSQRLKMTDTGGNVNGIVMTIPDAFPEAGFYLITADMKVASTSAAPINTFGMAAKAGGPSTTKVNDASGGYVLNLPDHPTNGAVLGYQTIGAGIQVPAGGTFPKDLTLYFSTDPSGEPGDAGSGNFLSSHRGSGDSWPLENPNTSAVFIDNIKRIGPGSFGEERHAYISIGDDIDNLNTLNSNIQQAHANGFNCIDILVRYRANRYFNNHRVFSTYPNNEPYISNASDSNDPVQFAIDRAHELGMRVYGSFSCFLVTDGNNNYPNVMPNGSVTYMYNGGNPVPQTTADDGSGLWADPGRADVREHTLNVVLDLVQNYDLDGIIFDRMRYQGNSFGYNPQALTEMGYNINNPPSPNNALFEQKRQAAVTTFLHDAYVAITDLKPWMIVGTVPVAYAVSMNDTYNRVFQSWPMWTATPTANRAFTFGAEDLIQPQFYRQWNSGGTGGIYNAPDSNRILMQKAVYGDTASDPMDFGLMPGANTNVAPVFATLGINDATDAANTADAIADNICDTQTDSFFMNGSGIFSATRLFSTSSGFGTKMITRIRNSSTACGSDVMAPDAPLPDFLMKDGWDNTPSLAVTGANAVSQGFSADITWNTPAPAADTETASHYLIYRSTSSSPDPYYENLVARGQTITGNSISDSNVPSSGNYYYRIVPVDDYNNKGPSVIVGPVTVNSAVVIVESRLANGNLTPSPTYTESVAMAITTSKSEADGLAAPGARYSTNVGMIATFRPNLPISGGYDVYVTMGDGNNNNAQAEYTITGSGSPIVDQVNLSFGNSNLVDKWLLLESDVIFDAGANGTIAFKNLDGNTGVGHRFVMDAVKLVRTSSGVNDWQLY